MPSDNLLESMFEDSGDNLLDDMFEDSSDDLLGDMFPATVAPTPVPTAKLTPVTETPPTATDLFGITHTLAPETGEVSKFAAGKEADQMDPSDVKDFFGTPYSLTPSIEEVSHLETDPFFRMEMVDSFMETMDGLESLRQQPKQAVKGAAEFFLSIPGFLTGVGVAAQRGSKNLLDQITTLKPDITGIFDPGIGRFDLEEFYDVLAESMADSMEFFEPAKQMLLGKPTPESQLVGGIAMAPVMALSRAGQEVAEWPRFEDSPNIRGIAKLTGDVTGFIALGAVLHKGIRTDVAKRSEAIVAKAQDIKVRTEMVEKVDNEALQRAQIKILEIQKAQLELEAAELKKTIEKGVDLDPPLKKDLKAKGKKVKDAKADIQQDRLRSIKKDKIGAEAGTESIKTARESKSNIVILKDGKEVIGPTPNILKESPVKDVTSPWDDEPLTNLRIMSYPPGYEQVTTTKTTGVRVTGKTKIVDSKIVPKGTHRPELIEDTFTLPPYWIEGKKADGTWESISRYYTIDQAEKSFNDISGRGFKPKVIEGIEPLEGPPELKGPILEQAEIDALMEPVGETKTLYTGSNEVFESTSDMPKGHRGYFAVESKEVASKFGKNIHEVELKTTELFDARKEDHVNLFMKEFKKRFPDRSTTQVEGLLRKGNFPFYEDTQTEFILEALGYKGNWQLEDGANTFRVFSRKDFDISPIEPTIELDRQTGVETTDPVSGEQSPFYQSPEESQAFKGVFEGRKSVNEDVEIFTQKLGNDVNLAYHGDKSIPIEKVRDTLRRLAAEADDFRMDFLTGVDHLEWKETVSNMSEWASGLRFGVERRGELPRSLKFIEEEIGLGIPKGTELKILAEPKKGVYTIETSDGNKVDIDALSPMNEVRVIPRKPKGTKLYSGLPVDRVGKALIDIKARLLEPAGEGFLTKTELEKKHPKSGLSSIDQMATRLGKKFGVKFIGRTTVGATEISNLPAELAGKELQLRPDRPIYIWSKKDPNGIERIFRTSGTSKNSVSIRAVREKSEFIDSMKGQGIDTNILYSGLPVEELLKLNKNFKRFFGKSKVKQTVYHGTPRSFTEFDPNKRYGGIGIHFGTREQAINRMKETTQTAFEMRDFEDRIFHQTNETFPGGKPPFDAYFGDKKFTEDFPQHFGKNLIELGLPKEKNIVDLNSGTNKANQFMADVVESIYKGKEKDYADRLLKGDKEAIKEFYSLWTGKEDIISVLEESGYDGAKFGGEYILPKETIKDLESSQIKPTLLEGFIRLENPLKFNKDPGGWDIEAINNAIIDRDVILSNKVKSDIHRLNKKYQENIISEVKANKQLENILIKEGYDGLEYPNNVEGAGTSYAVFNSNQFKSIDNIGTFGDTGNIFYSGLPLDKAGKDIITGAKKFKGYVENATGLKKFRPGDAARMLSEEFKRSFVDRSGNIRLELLDKLGDEGYKVVQKMYLTKGANSLSANMLNQMRKEVYQGMSKHEKGVLDKVILAGRMVAIGKTESGLKFNYPEGLTPTESAAYSELFPQLEKIPPERAQLINDRAEAYYEWMKMPLKDMRESGLISAKEEIDLAAQNYRKLKLVDIYDKKYTSKIGKKKITIYDSGVEALAKGRTTDVFEPSSEIMALEVFNRTYGRVLNNEAYKALASVAKNDSKNPFARVRKKGEHIPAGWQRIFGFEEGERKSLYISPEMSKEWITNNSEISYRTGQYLRWASGSPMLRTFATGINWGFAVANLPRDVMHTWFAARMFSDGKWSGVYSNNLPIFLPQIGADLARTFTDAVTKGPRYQEYIKEGGGMEFLVHQGRLFQRGRRLEGPADKIMDFLGYFGETSEIMTRLAIRDRVIRKRGKEQGLTMEEARKNKDITQEATFAARDYMDFGQGGGITKAADNAIPYLNAGVQGTRGLWRTAVENKRTFAYKIAQLGAVTTLTYAAAKELSPNTMANLEGSEVLENNLVLPLGDSFSFEDERGQTRYMYFKMPLDPGQKFFNTFFQASYDKYKGNEVDVDRVVESLKNTSPVGISNLPPTASAFVGYVVNKDFWRNEDIWKKTEPFTFPKSKEEFIPGRTSQVFMDIGKATGFSPERLQFATEELTTSGTMWSYLAGKGYEKLFADVPQEKKEQHVAMTLKEVFLSKAEGLSKTPIIKRFFGVTNPYSKYAGKIEEAQEADTIQRFVQNRELDRLTEGHLFEDSVTRKEVFKYVNSFKEKDIRDRLTERFDYQQAIKDLPERSFWLRLKGLNVEPRAQVYYDRWKKADEAERKQLAKEVSKIGAAGKVITDGFWNEFSRLRLSEED